MRIASLKFFKYLNDQFTASVMLSFFSINDFDFMIIERSTFFTNITSFLLQIFLLFNVLCVYVERVSIGFVFIIFRLLDRNEIFEVFIEIFRKIEFTHLIIKNERLSIRLIISLKLNRMSLV